VPRYGEHEVDESKFGLGINDLALDQHFAIS
jgi:hypothetical protein